MNKISDMTKLWWWLAGVIILAVFLLYFGGDIIHLWVVHGHLVRLG